MDTHSTVGQSADIRESVHQQALEWFLKIEAGDLSSEENAQHAAWLAESARNHEAFDRFRHVWSQLDVARDEALRHLETLSEPTPQPRTGITVAQWYLRRPAYWATAAAIALLVTGITVSTLLDWGGESYRTIAGEQRTIYLTEGSTIHLNAKSRAEVNMTDQLREVVLEEGEALFDVKSDPDRPFIVWAGRRTVRAVGTQFNIRTGRDHTTVTVVEGTVAVGSLERERGGSEEAIASVLNEGEQIAYTALGALEEIETVDLLQVTAWRDGRLIYQRTPLEDVVTDLNRYYPGVIKIGDPALSEITVSGIYNIGDREATLRALADFLPIKPVKMNKDVVVLLRR